jgi:predicted NBD/HSP70 family sugar kinase
MSCDVRWQGRGGAARAFPVRLARNMWAELPSVRVSYDRDDDAVVAEVLDGEGAAELVLEGRLLVELDDEGPGAMPVALTVTGVRADPGSAAVARARELLGETVWGVVTALIEGPGSGTEEIWLDATEARVRQEAWALLAVDRVVIGVEVRRDVVRAALVAVDSLLTGSNTVIGRTTALLERTDVDSVVAAVEAVVRELGARHPSSGALTCPVGVQIGGPVRDGVVRYYYKPKPGARPIAPWDDVPLADILRERLGRGIVEVANDAESFALHELLLRDDVPERFAVLVVRHGVGSRLVLDGRIVDLPMEIGTFIPTQYLPLDDDSVGFRSRESIEARSGIMAILDDIHEQVGVRLATAREAAELIRHQPGHAEKILRIFHEAGVGLGRGLAAVQSICSPDRWVVLGPPALVDANSETGAAYLKGLEAYRFYLDWPALRKTEIVGRPLRESTGALAAASVVVMRSAPAGLRPARRRRP